MLTALEAVILDESLIRSILVKALEAQGYISLSFFHFSPYMKYFLQIWL